MKRNKSRLEYLFSPKNYSIRYFFLSYAEDYAVDCIITHLSRQTFFAMGKGIFLNIILTITHTRFP